MNLNKGGVPVHCQNQADRRKRRTTKIVSKKLVPEFGSMEKAIYYMEEAGQISIADMDISEIPSLAKQHKKSQEALHEYSSQLIFHDKIKRRTYVSLNKFFKNHTSLSMRAYSTVIKKNINQIDPKLQPLDVLEIISSGNFGIISETCGYSYISMSNRFAWIFYWAFYLMDKYSLLGDDVMDTDEIVLHNSNLSIIGYKYELNLVSFLWYDGGDVSSTYSGLAAGIKIASVSLKDAAGSQIVLPCIFTNFLISYCWVLSCKRVTENRDNVTVLEEHLMNQYDVVKDNWNNVIYKQVKLSVNIIGVTSDHGIRSKLIPRDNNQKSRCGECSYLFIVTAPYRCLDWNVLTEIIILTSDNWTEFRNVAMPLLINLSSKLSELGLVTYDNLHFVAGHLKQFSTLVRSLVPLCNQGYISNKFAEITKQDNDKYYQGWHWRKLSLHFSEIFIPLVDDNPKKVATTKSLSCLFEIITEIHIFNYIHWNRNSADFEYLRLRYSVLLFMYTYQLKDVFSPDQVSQLDTVYMHKLLIHSIIVFRLVNLAACSCEGGEGLISKLKKFFGDHGNNTFDKCFGNLLIRFLFDEKFRAENFSETKTKSKVFTDEFLCNYEPKSLRLLLFDQNMRDSFTKLLKFSGFSDEFITSSCKFKRITRKSIFKGAHIFTIVDNKDANEMKKQLCSEFDKDVEAPGEIRNQNFLENTYIYLLDAKKKKRRY